MKKIIIALLLTGISWTGAQAQTTTKKCTCPPAVKKARAHSTASKSTAKSSDTYQVCEEKGGYYTCCIHHKTAKKTVRTTPVATNAVPAGTGNTKTVVTKTVVTKVATK